MSVDAQETAEESAEINARIDGEIPSILVTKWTPIKLVINDAFGIDWDRLSNLLPEWYMRLIWPLNPMFPQPVQRFLGYTSLRFEPEIVEGNPNGWFVRVNPSAVQQTNPGDNHSITLEVQVDDSAVDASVIVGIKCTRMDTLGGEIGSTYIYVPVKAAPTNFVKMKAAEDTMKHAGLKSMVYFSLDITNEGYYKDVFQFELEEENGLKGLFEEQAIVMEPGETKRVTLGILTPEKFFDPGTPSTIEVYVRSSGNATRTLVGTLTVITQGVYIPPPVGIACGVILIILLIVFFVFRWYKDARDRELYGKPNKPWLIPEERKYLQELKKKDPAEYNKVLQMMKEEYQSALLWFNSYRSSLEKTKETLKEKSSVKTLFKPSSEKEEKPVEQPKERKTRRARKTAKEEEPQLKPEDEKQSQRRELKTIFTGLLNRFKKEGKKEEKQVTEEKPSIPEPSLSEKDQQETSWEEMEKQRKKNQVLLKIKRQQEKQKRKLAK